MADTITTDAVIIEEVEEYEREHGINQEGITYTQIFRFLIAIAVLGGAVFLRKLVTKSILKLIQTVGSMPKEGHKKMKTLLAGPISFCTVMSGFYIGTILADLPDELSFIFGHAQMSIFHIVVFYIAYHSIDPVGELLHKTSAHHVGAEIREILTKLLKMSVAVIGFLTILEAWGINVGSFLTGLGLIGMAIALAAGDTIANLFGTLVILTDRLFQKGDWIKTPDVEGIVESFGVRMTVIRGFDTSAITIPNSSLANSCIVNYNHCTARQVSWTLPIVGPVAENFIKVISGFKEHLYELREKGIVADKQLIIVALDKFGCACIEVFVYFFTNETKWLPYMEIKEKVILEFNSIVTRSGCHFGVPTKAILLNDQRKKIHHH